MLVDVWVTPRASRPGVAGVADGRLRVRVASPALEDRANRELVTTLADLVNVPRRRVALESGSTARRKTVRIYEADADRVRRAFGL